MVVELEPVPADARNASPTPLAAGDARVEETPTAPERPLMVIRFGPPALRPLTALLSVLMTLSVAVAFFLCFAFGLSALQEQRSQHELYSSLRGVLSPSSPTAPSVGGRIPVGSPIALLSAPAAGLHDVVIVSGTTSGALLAGPGHLADTPLPGQAGESLVVGRSETAGAPFRHLGDLRRGDLVTVRTGQGVFRFTVKGRIAPGARPPTIRSNNSLLVLVTSEGAGGIRGLAPSRLLYVDAKLKGKVAATPAGQPRSVPAVDLQGHGDPGAWPYAAAWLGALFALSGLCWWLWGRWGILRTWLVGAPIALAILWSLSNEVIRLLPNVA